MPKIIEYFGLIFAFYSEDHLPVHVHAKYAEFESKFDIIFYDGKLEKIVHKKIRGKEPLPSKQRNEAIKVIASEVDFINQSWFEFFQLKKQIKVKKITKKI